MTFVDGLCNSDEAVRPEIAARPRFVKLQCVAEVVNPPVRSFQKQEAAAVLVFAVREDSALKRADVAPLRCAELEPLI